MVLPFFGASLGASCRFRETLIVRRLSDLMTRPCSFPAATLSNLCTYCTVCTYACVRNVYTATGPPHFYIFLGPGTIIFVHRSFTLPASGPRTGTHFCCFGSVLRHTGCNVNSLHNEEKPINLSRQIRNTLQEAGMAVTTRQRQIYRGYTARYRPLVS